MASTRHALGCGSARSKRRALKSGEQNYVLDKMCLIFNSFVTIRNRRKENDIK